MDTYLISTSSSLSDVTRADKEIGNNKKISAKTINNNNNLLHLYSAFLDTQSALQSKGDISSSTTNVQHPPGWCDGSHSAPERPPHTSFQVEKRVMKPISVWGWLRGHDGQRPVG